MVNTNTEFLEQIRKTNAFGCLDCGRCTAVCPVSAAGKQYSPRVLLTRSIRSDSESLYQDYDLWSCLTCGKCEEVCMGDIRFMDLIRLIRLHAQDAGYEGRCAHSGCVQSVQRLMTSEQLEPRRMDWLPEDVKIAEHGDILYFVGCAPFFQHIFHDIETDMLAASVNTIRILNHLGIEPVLLPDERCCGHDLYWNGDQVHFEKLARYNSKRIRESGANLILFSCAEGLSAFTNLYPQAGYPVNARCQHISQFLSEKMNSGELKLKNDETQTPVTYQDPCRLGRHLGIYDEPRQLLNAGSNGAFREMNPFGRRSLCCGVSGWMNCDSNAKAIQTLRLKQAAESGAEMMAVACPKCQIHLTCTQKDTSVNDGRNIQIRDIATLIWEKINRQGDA